MNDLKTRTQRLLLTTTALLCVSCSSMTGLRYTYFEIERLPIEMQENIRNKNVTLGMTPIQVRYTLGSPDEARSFSPQEGVVAEEWTYKVPTELKKIYIIFEKDEVVKIQTEGVRFPTIRIEKVENP